MNKFQPDVINISDLLSVNTGIDPITYQYFKSLKNRTIIINDIISDELIEMAIVPLIDMDNDGTGEPITIILNTDGGDVYSGMCLCDVIDNLKTPTTIHIMAKAASMGAIISMAGSKNPNVKKVCHKFTIFLIHSGSYFFQGSANAVRDTFKFQESYENKIKEYILTHTCIPEATFESRTRHEWYLTAEEALEYNIVDEIL